MRKGLVLFALLLTGCNEDAIFKNHLARMFELKPGVETSATSQTLVEESEQLVLQEYFAQVDALIFELKDEPKVIAAVQEGLKEQKDLEDLCKKYFVKRLDWEKIILRCTRNRFFLCAPEVANYADRMHSLRSLFPSELANRLSSIPACGEIPGIL